MNKFSLVKAIVKLYFLGALAVSFTHIIEASHKLGLFGWQSWTTPFAIDGIAVIGMVMRSVAFSTATRRLGFRVQITAGALSLACNVFAGNTLGERIYGVLIVALFVFSEWLSDRIESREVEEAREQAAKRSAAAAKASATRKANRQAAERMVKNSKRRMRKELDDILTNA
jgi:hypothetical protein